MRPARAAAAWAVVQLLLCADTVGASRVRGRQMDNHMCKVMCQRFGMKALGPAFVHLHPTECCKKCDDVYPGAPALLQLAPPPAAPVAAPPAKPAGGAPAAPAPVKR
ncbi:unnamed protein product [Prorocentrum cordatum]|uniref:Uncharacterized protein n=1 Tax=Prorocentrum cordatum TaxID=2364126 RepID=A0ABN9PQ61_9DINO|nr:unnamed protein product [Polarella glacialis]|mmetsp:Transcript_62335/g.161991  ORF Transcript_62335/g.161991 Transcript_62335/m.161991 type:complete len:107 (+) Transcript_62335:52-372(+)